MWMSKKDLAEEYSISTRTVERIISTIIKPRIGKGYPWDATVDVGGRVRVDQDTFHDALIHRKEYELGMR